MALTPGPYQPPLNQVDRDRAIGYSAKCWIVLGIIEACPAYQFTGKQFGRLIQLGRFVNHGSCQG
jgi:hypothetical protein